jgi:hypothetical protein
MRNALLRAMHREEGYSLVISMLLMAIMMVLLAVSLDAGSSSLRQSSLSLEWSRLHRRRRGANAAVTLVGESRAATNGCAIGTNNVCNAVDGHTRFGGRPRLQDRGHVGGLLPIEADSQFAREFDHVRAGPVLQVRDLLPDISEREQQHDGDGGHLFRGDISVGQGATVCGSVLSSGGGVTLAQQAQVVRSYSALGCTGKSGNVWTGGTGGITVGNTVTVQGSIKASNPSTATCASNGTSYGITQTNGTSTTTGTATACGAITTASTQRR